MRNIMNRRSSLILGLLLLAAVFVTAAPQVGLAQSNPLIGTWKLNLAKSKFSPGPPPRTQTLTVEADGQNLKSTADTIGAQGEATKIVFLHIYDGKPHPTTGAEAVFDANAYTRVDAYNVNWIRSKAGKTVQTGSNAVSSDGRILTVTTEGTGANGQPISSVAVYEKQ
jgi:hypothetical protein